FAYEEFFAKLEAHPRGLELLLAVATLIWVVHWSLFAIVLYSQKLGRMQKLAERLGPVRRVVENNFYVDAIYRWVFVKPVAWFSEKVLWKFCDRKVIDSLLVEGSAETVGLAGKAFAMLQTGVLQNYALIFCAGAVVLIGYFCL